MRLSQKAIDEFKNLYFEDKGIMLTDLQADLMAWKLLESYSIAFGIGKNRRPETTFDNSSKIV